MATWDGDTQMFGLELFIGDVLRLNLTWFGCQHLFRHFIEVGSLKALSTWLHQDITNWMKDGCPCQNEFYDDLINCFLPLAHLISIDWMCIKEGKVMTITCGYMPSDIQGVLIELKWWWSEKPVPPNQPWLMSLVNHILCRVLLVMTGGPRDPGPFLHRCQLPHRHTTRKASNSVPVSSVFRFLGPVTIGYPHRPVGLGQESHWSDSFSFHF